MRTVKRKKSGVAGFFGGKKTMQVLPSAKELHAFSDSLITRQRKQTAEMEAYADSLRTRNRTLNVQLDGLITKLDGQAQALSVRLFTATISAAIILLFLSYLTIHRELKRNAAEKKKRERLIGELQKSNESNEKLIKLRRNLIQNVTHELRTPLTAINGNAELLLNDTEADNRMRHAQTIHDAAGRMAGMINNLLVYFRLDPCFCWRRKSLLPEQTAARRLPVLRPLLRMHHLRKGGFTTCAFSLRPRTSMQISVPGLAYSGLT